MKSNMSAIKIYKKIKFALIIKNFYSSQSHSLVETVAIFGRVVQRPMQGLWEKQFIA